jgi:hypothetical protein
MNRRSLFRRLAGVAVAAVGAKTVTIESTSARAVEDQHWPIGSIYESMHNISPGVFLGGIWELCDWHSHSHTLYAEELPVHTHTLSGRTFDVYRWRRIA